MKHGFCCGIIPLVLVLACGLGALGYCHHGCRPHASGCDTRSSCSSCHSTSCSHHLICNKCGGAYLLGDSYRNEKLCPECHRLLREDLSSKQSKNIMRKRCEECGSKYFTTEADDCGLCSKCFTDYCSAQD